MGKTLRDSEDVLLKRITVANYRQDPYYARIVKAVEGLLREKGFVAPLELFIRLDLLSPEAVENCPSILPVSPPSYWMAPGGAGLSRHTYSASQL
jgi:hypothetical protein